MNPHPHPHQHRAADGAPFWNVAAPVLQPLQAPARTYTQGKPLEAPPRRALQQIRHNQVNVSVLQRLKNFVAPPRSGSLGSPSNKKAWSDEHTPTKSNKDSAIESPSSAERIATIRAAPAVENKPAMPSVMQSDDLLAGVLRLVDMKTALNCRAVNRTWKRLVSECSVEPLEAGLKGEELDCGLQSQQLLEECMERVHQIYTPEHSAYLANHISRQASVTEDMRSTLVNWVTEVHFKFKFRETSLQLALQLVDRYMADVNTGRRKYQTVGVTAFLLGCKFEERHSPNVGDLSYITDYSSSRQDIVDMEQAMLSKLEFDLVQPKPTDFIERYAKAGGLEANELSRSHHGFPHALILFFIDVAAINYKYCGMKPSDITAAAVSCALRAMGRDAWSKRLAYYTGIESIDYLADALLQSAKKTDPPCLKLKYSSQRFGGEQADGQKGVYKFLRRYLDALPTPTAQAFHGVYV